MLFLRLHQAFVFLFPLMISWNSVASSQRLWKRQTSYVCPNNKWKEYDGQCFLEIRTLSINLVGYSLCRDKFDGSFLAKIRSMDDLNFIRKSFRLEINNYWIGLFRRSGGSWTDNAFWADGSNATFVNFPAGQPTNNANEDCVSIHSDLGFYDSVCQEMYWSICSIPASVDLCNTENVKCHENAQCYNTFSTFVCLCNDGFVGDGISTCTQSFGCPNAEWKEHKGLCYIENLETKNFEDAQMDCTIKFNGSSLAKFRYEGDKIFFLNTYTFSEGRWIGLRRMNTWRDELIWDDKSNVTYKSYVANQPSSDDTEDCILTDLEGEWNDFSCNIVAGSFCSINAKVKDDASSSGGAAAILIIVLILLGISAYAGYNKFKVQRSNDQGDLSELNKEPNQDVLNSNAVAEN